MDNGERARQLFGARTEAGSCIWCGELSPSKGVICGSCLDARQAKADPAWRDDPSCRAEVITAILLGPADGETWEESVRCHLAAEALGPLTLTEIARLLGVSKQRAARIEAAALAKVKREVERMGLADAWRERAAEGARSADAECLGRAA